MASIQPAPTSAMPHQNYGCSSSRDNLHPNHNGPASRHPLIVSVSGETGANQYQFLLLGIYPGLELHQLA